MIEYNELINELILANVNDIVSLKLFLFVIFIFIFSLAIDVIFGELPGVVHPVVIMGSIISFFRNIFINIKNKISGVLTVLCASFAVGIILFIIYLICKINIVLLFVL